MYNMCIQYVIDCVCLVQRNYKGLKITVCLHSWGKLWTIKYKKNSNCQFGKAGSKSRVLQRTPGKEWANHLTHTSSDLLDTPPLSQSTRSQLALRPLANKQTREPVTCACSLLMQQGTQ